MTIFEVRTDAREVLVDVGPQVREAITRAGVRSGVVHLWALHTTCALTVNENADPDVKRDMVDKLRRLVPQQESFYRHGEGNSDAHVKTSLFGPGLTLIVDEGRPLLGRWQGIFLAEWDGPRTRRIAVQVMAG